MKLRAARLRNPANSADWHSTGGGENRIDLDLAQRR
jgi:hypothetical protein